MEFAIYCRKSKYTTRGESIESQLEYCTRYLELSFGDEPYNVHTYTDEGYSGKDLQRPAFKRMLQDCYAKKLDYVVVYRLDRVSRNVRDFANLYQQLTDLSIGFISTSERYDTSTSGGRAMLLMACVFAQLERETVSERVRDSMYSLAKHGRWLGGNTPTGYDSISYVDNTKVKFKLVPNQSLALVSSIYYQYLDTLSTTAVEKYLKVMGVKSPNGNYYSQSSIKTLLTNPVYCQSDKVSWEYLKGLGCNMSCSVDGCNRNGYIVYGRTSTSGGDHQKRVSPSRWVVAIGQHLGIIDGASWVHIQESLHRKDYRSHSVHNANSLLSGSIYCPKCHAKMVSRTKVKGFTYACSNKLQHGVKACDAPNVDGILDTMLLEELFRRAIPTDEVIPQLEALKRTIGEGMGDPSPLVVTDVSQTLKDGFNALPTRMKREYLQRLICNVEVY